jgi:toxin-antitoxin system PIN domain toxin
MQLTDVNVLVYAYRQDAPDHARYRAWLERLLAAPSAYGVSDVVLSGFLRVVTHPRVFDPPSPVGHAVGFADALRSRPNAVPVAPGPRHWAIFADLCRTAGVKGNLVPDAFLAALAIESGSEWITTDRDYARFSGLRWRHPLDRTPGSG